MNLDIKILTFKPTSKIIKICYSELNFSINDINTRYENIQSKTDIHLLSSIKLNQKSEKINILRKNDRVTISFNEDIRFL